MTRECYPSGGRGHRSTPGRHVSRLSSGILSLSADLTREWPSDCRVAQIQLDRDLGELYLRPERERNANGCITVILPESKSHCGLQGRLGTEPGMRAWGLIPDRKKVHPAQWRDGELVVDLRTDLIEDRRGPASPAAAAPDPPCDAEPVPFAPKASANQGTCLSCRYGTTLIGHRDSRLCRKTRKLGPATGTCVSWESRVEADRGSHAPVHESGPGSGVSSGRRGPDLAVHSGTGPVRRRRGSWPRKRCPDCGNEVPVTQRGFYLHDKSGRLMGAGGGDPENRCPGSHQTPEEE